MTDSDIDTNDTSDDNFDDATEAAAVVDDAVAAKGGKVADKSGKATIASADEAPEKKDPEKPYWPDDWRQKVAERVAAGDKKAYTRELKRLERISDPSGVYGMYREVEGKLTSGNLVRVPGKDATPEDIAQYHKAIGVPEKPADYIPLIKLANGAVIGDDDKKVIAELAERAHKVGTSPAALNEVVDWYYQKQEEQAAALDEADDIFRRESEQALKEELGATFKRKTTAIAGLFATAPGGNDIKNEGSLFSRLMGGRTADGRIIGNDPDMIRFLVSLSHEINPSAMVVDDASAGGKSIDDELAEIQALRKTDKRKYFSQQVQGREAELIAAKQKIQARS
jgi:hypothetical protein